jgi:hypothetical protein
VAPLELEDRLAWISAIREPAAALHWSLPEWERVIRLGRRLRLLARLAESLDSVNIMAQVPELPRRHLIGEQQVSRHRTAALAWALERIGDSLADLKTNLVLLKGAAYVAQGLPIARGRLPSDIDILVAREDIQTVTGRLSEAGWQEIALNEDDRRYYHEWSHELPPLVHPIHPIELDVHHNVVPPMARTHVDGRLLLSDLRPSPWSGWAVLAPEDQVLHSAAHLFFDSNVRDRVRDLVDLDGLLRHFGNMPDFWEALPERGRQLNLTEPLALACSLCVDWFGSPVPDLTLDELKVHGRWKPGHGGLVRIFAEALTPLEPDEAPSWRTHIADTLVLARYHRWRLPLALTVPHLWRKARGHGRGGAKA